MLDSLQKNTKLDVVANTQILSPFSGCEFFGPFAMDPIVAMEPIDFISFVAKDGMRTPSSPFFFASGLRLVNCWFGGLDAWALMKGIVRGTPRIPSHLVPSTMGI